MNTIYMALLPSNDGRFISIGKDELLTYFNAQIFTILKQDEGFEPVILDTEEKIVTEMNREVIAWKIKTTPQKPIEVE